MAEAREQLPRGPAENQENRNKGRALAMALGNRTGQEVRLSRPWGPDMLRWTDSPA